MKGGAKAATKTTDGWVQLAGEFRNTGKDPRFDETTEVYYQGDKLMGKLGPDDGPLAVTMYETNEFEIKVNGETLKSFVATSEERQVFEV